VAMRDTISPIKIGNRILSPVVKEKNVASRTFSLKQNYPNPFNPATTVSVDIAKESFVSLKVYNLLGQEIATLANGTLQPGSYQYRFDASRLPSGMYVYQLRAGDFVQSRKMMLTK
jgi:hypothetical protein